MSSFLETVTLASVGIIGAGIGAAASIIAVRENSLLIAKQNFEGNKKKVHQELQGYKFYIYHMMYRYIYALFQFRYYEYSLNNSGPNNDLNKHNESELAMWRSETHRTEIELIKSIRDLHKLLIQITHTFKNDESVKSFCDDLLNFNTYQLSKINFLDIEMLFDKTQEAVNRELASNWNPIYGENINQLLKIFDEEIKQKRNDVKQNEKPLMVISAYYWVKNKILETWNDEW